MGGKPLNPADGGNGIGTHDAQGYWTVASDGECSASATRTFYGSTGSIRLNKPVVGMAATP